MSAEAADRPTPSFRHDEPGTSEPEWLLDARWDSVAARDPVALADGVDRVVVVAAHPDDEVLGAGALVADLAPLVDEVVVVLATDGEGSHPPGSFAGDLARLRRAEARRGLDHVAPGARLVPLALPDGQLRAHQADLEAALAPLLHPRTLLLAPWRQDGHPDHDTAGRAAAEVAEKAGARLLEFPIWLWQWGRPDDLPWPDLVVVTPSADALHVKRAGIAEHRSQLLDGAAPGEAPLLGRHVLRRFERVVETFIWTAPGSSPTESGEDSTDGRYDDGDDPWGFETSWYEDRKRSLTAAMLARPRYRAALEVGCATGVLTRVLAARADHVIGMDTSRRALGIARQGAADARIGNISWVAGAAPDSVPDGPFDLVVLSEVGYFLTGPQWLATVRRVRSVLQPGGEVVLVNWRRRTNGIPLDGPLVQQQARDALGLPVRAAYADEDVEIDVLGEGPSLARQEGLG